MNNNTDITLCSKALLKIGASPIASFTDGTAEAEVSAHLYPLTRDGLLSAHPWSFAMAQITLNRLSENPLADYRYAYQLPDDLLRIVSAGSGNRGQGIDYRIKGETLQTNASDVNLTYIFRPEETTFPPFFSEALVAKLACEFCLPLTESTARAEFLAKIAEDESNRARLIDSQQDTPRCFEDFTLLEARS